MNNGTFILPVMGILCSKLSSQIKTDLFIFRVSKSNTGAKISLSNSKNKDFLHNGTFILVDNDTFILPVMSVLYSRL